MKKVKIFLCLFIGLLFATVIFYSCGGTQDKNRIRVMHWGDIIEMKNVEKIIKDIKLTKGITVTQERAPSGSPYMEKVMTEAAAGNLPDILFVEEGNFKYLQDSGLLVDLTPYIESDRDKDFNIKDYYPEIVDRFTVDNKLYVIPRDIAPICVIYYNKKLFDEAGVAYPKDDWTWKDLLDKAQKLTKRDAKGNVTQYGFLDEWTIWEAWVYSNGGAIVDDIKHPTKITLDSPEAIAGVQFRADLANKYKVTPPPVVINSTTMGWYGTASKFMEGKIAMFYTGYWKAGYFRDVKGFDWDVVMFPKGPTGKRGFPSGGSGYAITSQCKNKELAWQVLKRFAGKQGQIDLSSEGGLQPAIIKLAESKQFMDDQKPKNKKIMLEAVKYIHFTPLIKEWEEIGIKYINPALDRVWNDEDTAEKALKKITKEINDEYFSGKK